MHAILGDGPGDTELIARIGDLQLLASCNHAQGPAGVRVKFVNLGTDTAALNWFYAKSDTNLKVGGNPVPPNDPLQLFEFWVSRIEGQFIFSDGLKQTTVNLHAYDGTSFCEFGGTAVSTHYQD